MYKMRTLADVRADIDAIDADIERTMRARQKLSEEAQTLKTSEVPLFAPKRETEIAEAHKQRAALWQTLTRSSRCDLLDMTREPIGGVLGPGFHVIAGPCSIESEAHAFETAERLAAIGVRRMRGGCWKPRTSPYAFQGHGADALRWMRAACDRFGLELWTEVRDIANLQYANMIDVAWIGARNATNYELLRVTGERCPRVLMKRSPAQTVEEWLQAAEYIRLGGARVTLCERGIKGSDPMLRNTFDIAGALLARAMGGYEVIVDASHATGLAPLVIPLVKAARAAGLDGAIVEAHPRPAESVTDAKQAIGIDDVQKVLTQPSE
jgi:3-deoxy-7-phosphoheptulonate synthase